MNSDPSHKPEGRWTILAMVLAALCLLPSLAQISSAQTVVGGRASGVWTTAGSPYLLAGYVVVQEHSVLEIEPGVEVQLLGKGIYVGYETPGALQADGASFVGPGSIEFFRLIQPTNVGDGWIKNSTFTIDTELLVQPGANPVLENNSGSGLLTLIDGPLTLTQEWIVPPSDQPYLVDYDVTIANGGSLIAADVTIIGNGKLIFEANTSAVSRLERVDLSLGPDIIVYPGAGLELNDNVGIDQLYLPRTTIDTPGVHEIKDFGIPYVSQGPIIFGPESGLLANGISFSSGTVLRFNGPDLSTSVFEVQQSFLTACSFEEDAHVSIEYGSNVLIEQAEGLDDVLLLSGELSSSYDWTLPNYGLPYRISGTLRIGANSGLTIDGMTFVGTGIISIGGPDERLQPEDSRVTRISNSIFEGTVRMQIELGSQALLSNNSGIDKIYLGSSQKSAPVQWVLPNYDLPIQIDETVPIRPDQDITIEGATVMGSGQILMMGPTGAVSPDQVRSSRIINSNFIEAVSVAVQPGVEIELDNNTGIDKIYLSQGASGITYDWTMPDLGLPFQLDGTVRIRPEQSLQISNQEFLSGGRLIFEGPNGNVAPEDVQPSLISNSTFATGLDIGVQLGSNLTLEANSGIDHILWINGSELLSGNWTLPDYGVPVVVKDFVGINGGKIVTISGLPELRLEVTPSSIGTISVGYRNESTLDISNATISGGGRIYYSALAGGDIRNSVFLETNIYSSSQMEIRGNRFEGQATAISVAFPGAPSIHENDFIETTVAVSNFTGQDLDLRNNYWGHFSGPTIDRNPNGRGGRLIGPVLYSPWSLTPFTIPVSTVSTDVPESEFSLSNPFPNPSTSETTLAFSLPEPAHVSLVVYDLLGRPVVRLMDAHFSRGLHETVLSAATLSSGLYVAVLQSEGKRLSRPVTIVR